MPDRHADQAQSGDRRRCLSGAAWPAHGHGEHAVGVQRVGQHLPVTRLEDVERQQRLREQRGVGQGHHRDLIRQLHAYNVGEASAYSSQRWMLAKPPATRHVDWDMTKNQIGLAVSGVICLGLVIALVATKNQANKEKQQDTDSIVTFSNKWVEYSDKLDDQKKVTTMLEKDLDTQKKALGDLTNTYTEVASNLTRTETSLKTSLEEVAKRDAKIADTQKKLAASEGNREFLEQELKRLTSEKAELERQFNDLAVLRAQVSKLKDELSIARRLDWLRRGIFANAELKGAQ